MNDNSHFKDLLDKYVSGQCSGKEHDEFFELLLSGDFDDTLKEKISTDYYKIKNAAGEAELPPHIAEEIMRNIIKADQKLVSFIQKPRKKMQLFKWVAAACLLGLIFLGYQYFSRHPSNKLPLFQAIIPPTNKINKNNTQKPLQIILSDGSQVVLQPNSAIYYPNQFSQDEREVYLEGDASFDVAHNPEKPFLVYCKDIVTKVLGTRFEILTDEAKGDVEVSVKSGKVQVFENGKLINNIASEAVILTPNQRAIYVAQTHVLASTLVKEPVPLDAIVLTDSLHEVKRIPLVVSKPFLYDQTSLTTVFEDIEKVYGIEVEVENSNLNNCVFTGDVGNKDLFVLLKIICLSTNSSYEINGTKILIKGRGCAINN